MDMISLWTIMKMESVSFYKEVANNTALFFEVMCLYHAGWKLAVFQMWSYMSQSDLLMELTSTANAVCIFGT